MQAVTYFGSRVAFPDMPERASFFAGLEAGRWEPSLFGFLSDHLDGETVFIDIGGWIGVTSFWAAQRAKRVLVVEPDPVCGSILSKMSELNPGKVAIYKAAVSNSTTLRIGSVGGFGSSQTSALASDQAIEVPGITLAELVAEADAPVCIKIDVEGYEYHIIDQLTALDPAKVKAISLAMHPAFFEASGKARLETVIATLRVAWALRRFHMKHRFRFLRSMISMLHKRRLRFFDLTFERS